MSQTNEGDELLDVQLLSSSPVVLYWRESVLREDASRLQRQGYRTVEFDASWSTLEAFHDSLARGLAFPDYYGRNLDALNDCLRDLEFPATGKLALIFLRFDLFAAACPSSAQSALDILAIQSRCHSIHGHRLLTLVQSNNPKASFEPVGASPVLWNPREWLDRSRGLEHAGNKPLKLTGRRLLSRERRRSKRIVVALRATAA